MIARRFKFDPRNTMESIVMRVAEARLFHFSGLNPGGMVEMSRPERCAEDARGNS